MRKRLTVGVVAAVFGVAALALFDALARGPGTEARNESGITGSRTGTIGVPPFTAPGRVPAWRGVIHREIRLESPVGFAWEEIRRFSPGAHTLRVRVDLPSGAEVEIWFESAETGARIDVLGYEDRGNDPDCEKQASREICVRSLGLQDIEAGAWRLVARKLSRGRATVRLTVAVNSGTGGTE